MSNSDMSNSEIRRLLERQVDAQVRETLMSGYPAAARPVMGVPASVLSQWAREAVSAKGWRELVDHCLTADTYEEVLLGAFILGEATDIEPDEAIARTKRYVELLDSRRLCDSVCLALRSLISWPVETLAFLRPLLNATQPYVQRFAIVMLLDYFANDRFLNHTLTMFGLVTPFSPEAIDALAWGYSVSMQVNPALTLKALEASTLDAAAFNAVQQRIETSPRLADAVKTLAAGLRRH